VVGWTSSSARATAAGAKNPRMVTRLTEGRRRRMTKALRFHDIERRARVSSSWSRFPHVTHAQAAPLTRTCYRVRACTFPDVVES
jgi:hypothetical protein